MPKPKLVTALDATNTTSHTFSPSLSAGDLVVAVYPTGSYSFSGSSLGNVWVSAANDGAWQVNFSMTSVAGSDTLAFTGSSQPAGVFLRIFRGIQLNVGTGCLDDARTSGTSINCSVTNDLVYAAYHSTGSAPSIDNPFAVIDGDVRVATSGTYTNTFFSDGWLYKAASGGSNPTFGGNPYSVGASFFTMDYSLAILPAVRSAPQGLYAEYIVTLNLIRGYNGTVALSYVPGGLGSPPTVLPNFNPDSVSASTVEQSNFIITVPLTANGLYTLTVQGDDDLGFSDDLVRQATCQVNVTAALNSFTTEAI